MKTRILKTTHSITGDICYIPQVKTFLFWKNCTMFNSDDDGDFYELVNYRTNQNQHTCIESAKSFLREYLEYKNSKKIKDEIIPFEYTRMKQNDWYWN